MSGNAESIMGPGRYALAKLPIEVLRMVNQNSTPLEIQTLAKSYGCSLDWAECVSIITILTYVHREADARMCARINKLLADNNVIEPIEF